MVKSNMLLLPFLVLFLTKVDVYLAISSEWTDVYNPESDDSQTESKYANCVFRACAETLLSEMRSVYPSAERIGLGKMEGVRLQFGRYVDKYKSITAAPREDPGSIMYGALYSVDEDDLTHFMNIQPLLVRKVEVELIRDEKTVKLLRCYTRLQPSRSIWIRYGEVQPWFMRPTEEHLETILLGYEETGIPEFYINSVASIPTDDLLFSRKNN